MNIFNIAYSMGKTTGVGFKKGTWTRSQCQKELSLDLDLKFVFNSRCGLSLSGFDKTLNPKTLAKSWTQS